MWKTKKEILAEKLTHFFEQIGINPNFGFLFLAFCLIALYTYRIKNFKKYTKSEKRNYIFRFSAIIILTFFLTYFAFNK